MAADETGVQIIATITIKLTSAGQLAVEGNIENKTAAYGMLMTAMDAIRDMHANATKRIVEVPMGTRLS